MIIMKSEHFVNYLIKKLLQAIATHGKKKTDHKKGLKEI